MASPKDPSDQEQSRGQESLTVTNSTKSPTVFWPPVTWYATVKQPMSRATAITAFCEFKFPAMNRCVWAMRFQRSYEKVKTTDLNHVQEIEWRHNYEFWSLVIDCSFSVSRSLECFGIKPRDSFLFGSANISLRSNIGGRSEADKSYGDKPNWGESPLGFHEYTCLVGYEN